MLVPFVSGLVALGIACVGDDPGSSTSSGSTSSGSTSSSSSSSGDANSETNGTSSGTTSSDGPDGSPADAGPCRMATVDPVPSGLIGYWPLQDVSLTDITGQHGSVAVQGSGGTLGPVADRFGCAKSSVAFNGSSIELGKATLITNALSIQLWVKPDVADAAAVPEIFGNETQVGGDNGTMNIYHDNQSLIFSVGHGTGFASCVYAPFRAGVWHHVVATLTATRSQLYVDGLMRDAEDYSGLAITNTTSMRNWRIGRLFNQTRPFAGAIDDVRFYNRVLSDADVKSLFEEHAYVPPQ